MGVASLGDPHLSDLRNWVSFDNRTTVWRYLFATLLLGHAQKTLLSTHKLLSGRAELLKSSAMTLRLKKKKKKQHGKLRCLSVGRWRLLTGSPLFAIRDQDAGGACITDNARPKE